MSTITDLLEVADAAARVIEGAGGRVVSALCESADTPTPYVVLSAGDVTTVALAREFGEPSFRYRAPTGRTERRYNWRGVELAVTTHDPVPHTPCRCAACRGGAE